MGQVWVRGARVQFLVPSTTSKGDLFNIAVFKILPEGVAIDLNFENLSLFFKGLFIWEKERARMCECVTTAGAGGVGKEGEKPK